MNKVCSICCFGEPITYGPNPNSFDDSQNLSDYPPQPQYQSYSCELCGNDAHYGYDCPPQVPFVYNQNPSFDQNFYINFPQTSPNFSQTLPNFSQQNLDYENYGGPHATFQCQPMNQNFYDSNSFGFDQIEPPQHFINNLNQINNELCTMMETFNERINQQREQEAILEQELAAQREQELLKQAAQEKQVPSPYSIFHQLIEEMCGTKASAEQKQKLEEMMLELLELCREKELYCVHDSIEDLIGMAMNTMLLSINLKSQRLDKEKQEVKNIVEQATKRRTRITESLQNFTIIHKKSSISLNNTPQISLVIAITPDLPTEEPDNSLSTGDEHLSTISETESDKVIKSSIENLVPIPSESKDFSDNESECDVPVCDDFTNFSNPLFDSDDDFSSIDDESFFDEDIDPHYFNAESNLIESLLNRDTLIDSSPKFDYLLEEFSGELAHIDPIPPGMEEADFDLEEEIRLVENLSYDNSSPRPPEKLNAEINDTIVESLSPPLIPVEDSDSRMEEIDLFLASDDLMPLGIENDYYDSEGDIYFLEELLSNDPLPLPENESSNLDHFNDPLSPHPPLEPPDVEICLNFKPCAGILTTKMVKGISEHYVLMPNTLATLPTIDPDSDFTPSHDSLRSGNKIFDPGIFIEVQSERLLSLDEFSISFIRDPLFDTLLPFSSENEDKVFNPGILASPFLSHRDKIIYDSFKSPMMIFGGDIPLLDVTFLHFYPP
ncbi:hypothetical protein Tco_1145585 [Tanacetum coccineum]